MQSEHHLHPLSLLFSLGQVARGFLLPAVLLLIFGRGEGFEVWLPLFAVPALAFALARYLSYRYRFDPDELVVREGILNRKERHVPYRHIHSIDTSRTVVHRLLGVSTVSVQTASGAAPEAVMSVLSTDAVEGMRRRVFAGREADEPAADADRSHGRGPAAAEQPVFSASPTELLRHGIISNRGMVALAAIVGLAVQAEILPTEERLRELAETIPGVEAWSGPPPLMVIAGGVVLILALLRLLSMAWSLVQFYGFRLTRRGDELRTRYGLLTQRTITIPRHRVQILLVESTPLHRLLDRVSVRARTAGALSEKAAAAGQDWLAPVLPSTRQDDLLTEVQPELTPADSRWRSLHPRAVRRLGRIFLLPWLLPAVLLAGLLWPWGAVTLVPAALLPFVIARRWVAHTGYALADTAVWFRSGWIRRTLRVVRFSKIQSVTLVESPFDRRHGMASVQVDTANAGARGAAIRIPYLNRDIAEHVADRIGFEAAATTFRW